MKLLHTIHTEAGNLYGLVESGDRSHVCAFNPESGDFICSCEDHGFRRRFCKHLQLLFQTGQGTPPG